MDPITVSVVHNLSRVKDQITLTLNKKMLLEAYTSIHDQRFTVHARVVLFILILKEMVQTLPTRKDSLRK